MTMGIDLQKMAYDIVNAPFTFEIKKWTQEQEEYFNEKFSLEADEHEEGEENEPSADWKEEATLLLSEML